MTGPNARWRGIPFDVVDGWPRPVHGCAALPAESGLTIGSIWLDDEERDWLASRPGLQSVRIDEHDGHEEYGTTPPGQDEPTEWRTLVIPELPVPVPSESRGHDLFQWVCDTHGTEGRLLMWDETQTWWLASDAFPELIVVSARADCPILPEPGDTHTLSLDPDELVPEAREQIAILRRAYNLPASSAPTN
jgi:hypothetical protein